MSYFRYLFVFLALSSCTHESQELPACPAILNYAHHELPHSGILKNSNGLIYVDVDNAYIHKLIKFIQKDGFEEPPYFGSSDLVGAHITVISANELGEYRLTTIEECGEKIEFTLKDCKVARPPKWKRIDEVYLIMVDAPQLDALRQKYGLPKKKYDFHITIGVKPKALKSA